MKYKIASAIHIILAIAGAFTLLYSSSMGLSLHGPLGYGLFFILIPLIAAYGIWKHKTWGLIVGLIFLLPQCVNYVGDAGTYKFMAPISLGLSLGDLERNESYFLNLFAIAIALFLLSLFKPKKHTTQPSFKQDD